jgi:arginase family enzyme
LIDVRGLKEWGGLPQVPLSAARFVVAGIPYDGSAVYRRGAAEAPAAIRRLSAIMPPMDERGRPLPDLALHDLGDLDLGASVEGDAHPDLCDWSRGGRWTCGCALRRAVEVAGIDPASLLLVGCRDFDPEEVEWMTEHSVTMVTAAEVAADPEFANRVAKALAGRPVHVSFDIDALDPAHAPGTEIASAGGLTTRQALDLLGAVSASSSLVGFDLCEVAPSLDHADVTVLAALKLTFETWGRVAAR